MKLNFFELAFTQYERGFAFMSLEWNDGTFASMLGYMYIVEERAHIFMILGLSIVLGPAEEE